MLRLVLLFARCDDNDLHKYDGRIPAVGTKWVLAVQPPPLQMSYNLQNEYLINSRNDTI
jgi:hypothetical protein